MLIDYPELTSRRILDLLKVNIMKLRSVLTAAMCEDPYQIRDEILPKLQRCQIRQQMKVNGAVRILLCKLRNLSGLSAGNVDAAACCEIGKIADSFRRIVVSADEIAGELQIGECGQESAAERHGFR